MEVTAPNKSAMEFDDAGPPTLVIEDGYMSAAEGSGSNCATMASSEDEGRQQMAGAWFARGVREERCSTPFAPLSPAAVPPAAQSSSDDDMSCSVSVGEGGCLIDDLAHPPHHNDLVLMSELMDVHFDSVPEMEVEEEDDVLLDDWTYETTSSRLDRYAALDSSLSDDETWDQEDPKDDNYNTGSADTSGGRRSPGSSYEEMECTQ